MKKRYILLLLLTLGLVIGSAFARNRYRMRPGPRPRPMSVRYCLTQLDLTPEQIAEIQAIRQAALEALREAETPEEARAIIEQMHEAIKAVLTEEQLAALKECLRPNKPASCWSQLDLTEEQIAAIDAIRDAAMEALKQAQTPQEARDIIDAMHQDIEAVLTEEQLAALRECLRPRMRLNCLDQIGLTDEQIAAIEAIRQAAMEALKDAETREEVREIMDQMYQDIMAVLTDDQLAALQECRDAQRPGPRPRPEPTE
jgi:Spy/CpxP family protein refolding chaperone